MEYNPFSNFEVYAEVKVDPQPSKV